MPRNPSWTAQDAASFLSSVRSSQVAPFSGANLGRYENWTGQVNSGFIALDLKASSAYSFNLQGQYTTTVSYYDPEGYLLNLTGMLDQYGFRPPTDGRYYVVIDWKYIPITSTGWRLFVAHEDVNADGMNSVLEAKLEAAYSSVMRVAQSSPASVAFAHSKMDLALGTGTDLVAATKAAVSAADATTSVATMAYQFFTGKIPGLAGIDYLVSPTGPNANNLNSAYYQSFNLENRYINFAVNLGKLGEGKDAFTAKYGNLSLFDATREAYKTIFGGTPTDAKVHALIDTRVNYFASYGGDGPNGLGTKAAMVGWLLAEAEKGDLGVMARSNAAWLTDLSDGAAPFAIDILAPGAGYYKVDFIFGG